MQLACSIDVSISVRKYLDCVSYGKMYAQSMAGVDGSFAGAILLINVADQCCWELLLWYR